MLVVKSSVELLHLCGINILVVFIEIPEFCLDYKLYLPLKTFQTRNNIYFPKKLNCIFAKRGFPPNQRMHYLYVVRITTKHLLNRRDESRD